MGQHADVPADPSDDARLPGVMAWSRHTGWTDPVRHRRAGTDGDRSAGWRARRRRSVRVHRRITDFCDTRPPPPDVCRGRFHDRAHPRCRGWRHRGHRYAAIRPTHAVPCSHGRGADPGRRPGPPRLDLGVPFGAGRHRTSRWNRRPDRGAPASCRSRCRRRWNDDHRRGTRCLQRNRTCEPVVGGDRCRDAGHGHRRRTNRPSYPGSTHLPRRLDSLRRSVRSRVPRRSGARDDPERLAVLGHPVGFLGRHQPSARTGAHSGVRLCGPDIGHRPLFERRGRDRAGVQPGSRGGRGWGPRRRAEWILRGRRQPATYRNRHDVGRAVTVDERDRRVRRRLHRARWPLDCCTTSPKPPWVRS